MFGTYAAAALICAASLLVGRAIFAWAGRDAWCWLEPAVGFAAIIAVAGVGVRLPGGGTVATLLVVALSAASLVALRLPYRLRGAVLEALPVVVVLAVVLAIPFAVSGRWGLLGVGFNNDLGLHLAWSEWLRSGFGPEPDSGYPLGPHGLAIAAAAFPSISLGQAFIGEIIAIAIITGLTALGALAGLGPARRTLAAVLVAVPYLAASYFAQAAFKETAEAMFVLATAIAMPEVTPLPAGRRDRLRALAPLLVLAAGIFFSYSFAGLAWPIAIAALWALTFPSVRRLLAPRALWARLRRRATIAWLAGLGAAVLLLAFVGPFGFAGGFGKVAGSNTYGPVSPFEALGFWPAANYRLDAAVGGAPLAGLAATIACLALIAGLVWWVRRGELAVPIALAACALLYVVSLPFSGDYSRAKALMIAAPLVMLIASRALLAGPGAGWRAPPAAQPRLGGAASGRGAVFGRLAWGLLAIAFLGGAAYSTFLVLREAPIGPPGHGAELAAFKAELHGENVLYAGQDRFAAYELLGADTDVPVVEFPDPDVQENPTKPFDTGNAYSPIDFDSFTYSTLNHHKYLITGAAAWNSQAPSSMEEIGRTDSYILWKRTENSPEDRQSLLEGTQPATRVDCASPEIRILVAHRGPAGIFASAPVIGSKDAWDAGPVLETGQRTSQTLDLPAGRWLLSLQYFSPFDVTLSAPGFEEALKPALDGQRPNTISLANDGQYWPAGQFVQRTAGPVRFTLTTEEASTLQRLTGYDGKAYFGQLVAVRAEPRQTVDLGQTCGRWLDWYESTAAP
jgi:hypothetical protein